MQDGLAVQRGQCRGAAGVREVDGREADLLPAGRHDRGAEGRGHELGAEADAEGGAPLVHEPRVGVGLAGAHRTAEDDRDVGVVERRQLVHPALEHRDRVAPGAQHRFEDAEILEGDVADGDDCTHGCILARDARPRRVRGLKAMSGAAPVMP